MSHLKQRLKINVLCVEGLDGAGLSANQGCYVKFRWRGEKYKTEPKKREGSRMQFAFTAILPFESDVDPNSLVVQLWSTSTFSHKKIAETTVDLTKAPTTGSAQFSFPLVPEGRRLGAAPVLVLALQAQSFDQAASNAELQRRLQQHADEQRKKREFERQQTVLEQRLLAGRPPPSVSSPPPYAAPGYAPSPPPCAGYGPTCPTAPSPPTQAHPAAPGAYPNYPYYPGAPSGAPPNAGGVANALPQPQAYPAYTPNAGFPAPHAPYSAAQSAPGHAYPPQYGWATPQQPVCVPVLPQAPPPQQQQASVTPSGHWDEEAIKYIKNILPQCSRKEIEGALSEAGGDREKAVDILLKRLVAHSAEENENQVHELEHQMLVFLEREGRRKALLIGINYRATRAELRGCVNDVYRMRTLLCAVYGFHDSSTTLVALTDDNPNSLYRPTRNNILKAMRWLTIDNRPGDSLFFHYSGHGGRQIDRSGIEEDGYDETILPVDFDTAGQILDDELHAFLVQPLQSGCRLTAVMDCCHSGTGLDLPFTWNTPKWRWEEETNPFYVLGDVQMFSGCQDDQTSADLAGHEDRAPGGAMTTAFIAVLTLRPFGHSYPSLMQGLTDSMVARGLSQRPQLTSSQKFDFNRPFNLADVIPNQNKVLGRQIRRRRKALPAGAEARGRPGAGIGDVMLLAGAGLATGLLVGSLLND
ncbi:hypothetical protein NCLIV_044210 [Neospora caninum Liverpool]|uniref:ICE family protease (Caspase) p20 domain-containing protein n=1 Tax=Neospora caninum (strain Liverpool) TaxID=572307 RepID=F0VAY1_NEOCL|nr:hypothetical protein NCLIV_044210 [Neospora caninum Liverpool]CBZ51357.1 hypothetical protein NCLIV_044210 [Neospora caninum Liverpool]CEL68676.1 TPA: ICE family protease (caspase) p20 domain-containing protein [Neospora caninum Liverpool]|eukprot:XP_003881390.1 hypothetical protein NCLIV_044210 [Neospora caninum Liverpool]